MRIKSMLITGLMGIIISLFMGTGVYAEEVYDDSAYKIVLEKINEEYGTHIGYITVDPNEINLIEYESEARKVAEEQVIMYQMIASRVECAAPEFLPNIYNTRLTKTRDSDVWNYETRVFITATYDVSGTTISNPRNISYTLKPLAILLGVNYTPDSGYPTTTIIDSGRTLGVIYIGTLHSGGDFGNTLFYTEFYYNS